MTALRFILVAYFALNILLLPVWVSRRQYVVTPTTATIQLMVWLLTVWVLVAS